MNILNFGGCTSITNKNVLLLEKYEIAFYLEDTAPNAKIGMHNIDGDKEAIQKIYLIRRGVSNENQRNSDLISRWFKITFWHVKLILRR